MPDANTVNYMTNMSDPIIRSSLSDVGVAFDVYAKDGDHWVCDLLMSFNGLYVESMLPITFSYTLQYIVSGNASGTVDNAIGRVTLNPATDFASRYWTATLPTEYNEGGIITEQGALDREQQKQIADQQAQQSQQQHENLVNGYDNADNNSMLSDKNSVLQGFEQQQNQAISSGQQHISDFSAQYDTAIFSSMAPSFALVSTMFNTLWNGMGQFSTVLIIGLVLCVAGYILKLKH